MKLTREFDKGGEKRSAAKRIAESLQNDLKEFMEDSIPLMLLICNPGMQERHWEEVENITGVSVPKGGNYTLSMMTEIGTFYTDDSSVIFHLIFWRAIFHLSHFISISISLCLSLVSCSFTNLSTFLLIYLLNYYQSINIHLLFHYTFLLLLSKY